MTTTKKEFLKSEYNDWDYWQRFSYAEYLRVMREDAVKCKCGAYYWKEFPKKCKCK